jgi:hypothetical protein
MKDFNQQWQKLADQARQAPPRDQQAPFGFAAQVVALGWQAPNPGLELIWRRLALRSFAGAVIVLILCAVLEWPHFRDQRPLDPGLENTVARLVWTL